MNFGKNSVKPILSFDKKQCLFFLSFIIFINLFSFNVFASPGRFFQKIRTAIADFVFPPDRSTHAVRNRNTEGKIKAILRMDNEDFFLEDASRQEIFESFSNVFKRTDKGTPSRARYTQMIFDTPWEDREFREIIFDSIAKEDLSKPDFLLKWWEQAKVAGAESRLAEYTDISLTKLRLEQEPDQFMKVAMRAVKESDNFRREWITLVKNSDLSVTEQDFDVIFRNADYPEDYLPGPSWDEIIDLVDQEGRRRGSPRIDRDW